MLLGAYPNANVTEETIVVYETMLSDLPSNDVVQIVLEHIASSKWFPAIAEIREKVFNKQLDLPPAEAVLAWLNDGSVPEGSIPREAVRLCGGYHSYRHSTKPEIWRAEFRATYEKLRKRERAKLSDAGLRTLVESSFRVLSG
jgi:hypothetical protein